MNCFIGETEYGTNVFGGTFHRSSLTLYLTNLELYLQTPVTNSYEYIFCYIILFIYLLHTEAVSL